MLCRIDGCLAREADDELFGSEHRGALTMTARDRWSYDRIIDGPAMASGNDARERLAWGASLREIRRSFARAANGSELLSNARADIWAKLPADARAGVS